MRLAPFLRSAPFVLAGGLLASGCPKSVVIDSFAAPNVSPLVATLTTAVDCDDLLVRLRADARAKAEAEAFRRVETFDEGGYRGGPIWYAEGGFPAPPSGSPATADGAAGGPTSGGAASPTTWTETNTQVPGVDEADFVENDGTHLYLLHDRSFYVLSTYPAASTAIASTTAIEGEPRAMFVANGRAAIFSEIWTPTPIATDGGTDTPAPAPGYDLPYYGYGTTSTKLTVLDLAGASPTVVSERYLESAYVDARRHGDVVRLVVSGTLLSPMTLVAPPSAWTSSGTLRTRQAYVGDVADWLADVHARIDASTLDDFLPSESVVASGVKQDVALRCGDYHLPPAGQTDAGLVTILGFSMADPTSLDAESIVGRADVVYANDTSFYLAQGDWRWERFSGIATQETVLHRFDLSGLATSYVASGKVVGNLKDQFSIDAAGDVVRLATSEDRATSTVDVGVAGVAFVATEPVSHVVTLVRNGARLAPLGSTPDLAPGERLQAVRFLGDKAYVVTFRQVDPLFVVDLANPAAPTVRGEVTIPGFSTYVHPLDAGHLLTIGRDVDPVTNADRGVQLSIFDVTDPAHPTRLHVLSFPGWSGAAWDHKAFVFEPTRGLLAIPVESYGETFESSLRLFSVSLATGITPLGGVVHTGFFSTCLDPLAPGAYGCGYPATVRRGLFVDTTVFTVSYGGVTAHDLASLAAPLATVALPQPAFTWEGPYFLGLATTGSAGAGTGVVSGGTTVVATP